MNRTMNAAALAAMLGMACQMSEPPRPGFGVRTESMKEGGCECAGIPPMPEITTWLNFDTYPWGAPLYRGERVQSAYTIFLPHPSSSTKFLAYGWDPKGQASVFAGEGQIAVSYSSLIQQIATDEVTTVAAGLVNVSFGGSGEIGPGPGGPGPGGPVTDEASYLAAYKQWLAHEELKASLGGTPP
jgi:hypothetical protein